MFKVGDKIVDNGQVYEIFKIKREKALNGAQEKVIYYNPYFKSRTDNALTCSVPIKNFKKANIRKPVSKKGLRRVLKTLSERTNKEEEINITQTRKTLLLNNPYKTALTLRKLWVDKNNTSTNFSRTRREVLNLAMQHLTQEVAFVDNTSLDEAQKKIKGALMETKNEKRLNRKGKIITQIR